MDKEKLKILENAASAMAKFKKAFGKDLTNEFCGGDTRCR